MKIISIDSSFERSFTQSFSFIIFDVCRTTSQDFILIYSLLRFFFLQRNQIASIADCALCDLTSLKGLDLQANQLANLSGPVFSRLASLETLDLSQNPLLALDATVFTGLTAVRVLQVSRVHSLTIHLPDTLLDPLKGLQILEMYGSPRVVERICNTTRMLHSLRSLRELNIMHNDITTLRPDFPVFFPKLQVQHFPLFN